MKYKILVSACLAGKNCRYDGSNKTNEYVKRLVERNKAIPVCPEELGGLPTPRKPAEIFGGDGKDVLNGKARVLTNDGEDVTEYFVRGAKEVLKLLKLYKISKAILKARSPSCGCGEIYDGSFSGRVKKGDGVLTALLKRNRIKIFTEDSYEKTKI